MSHYYNFETLRNSCDWELVLQSLDRREIGNNCYELFDRLLMAVDCVRTGTTEHAERMIQWLDTTDFYEAPASTIFHDAFQHGLIQHTLHVAYYIKSLHQVPKFQTVQLSSAILVALCHDLCKIGIYEQFMKNQKNEETGQWEKVPAYRRTTSPIPMGHGAASAYVAQKFFKLSMDEALAIRWHMGAASVIPSEQKEYWDSNDAFPIVNMLQFADRMSTMKE